MLFFTFIADVVQKSITAALNGQKVDILSIVSSCATSNLGHNLESDLKELFADCMREE